MYYNKFGDEKMIICIVGPTGVGKTKLSESLAVKYNAIVVNADSVQIYKELNIGSAKPKEEEKSSQKHYLFDHKSISDDYDVYSYQTDLRKIIDENKDKNIVIVGGTGLYINAALYDYKFNKTVSNLESINERKENNQDNNLLYDVSFIGLTTSRDLLYERINLRVDKMMNEGLLDEVKELYKKNKTSRVLGTAIGYKELISYLNGEISLDESINLIKQNSRRYAKRQYTWFNNKNKVNWFDVDFNNFDRTINEIVKFIDENN